MSENLYGYKGNRDNHKGTAEASGCEPADAFGFGWNWTEYLGSRRIGLSSRLVGRELDFFAKEQPLAQELIRRSFLSEKLQRCYWQSYNYRRTTLYNKRYS